jgi:hypothetical protein
VFCDEVLTAAASAFVSTVLCDHDHLVKQLQHIEFKSASVSDVAAIAAAYAGSTQLTQLRLWCDHRDDQDDADDVQMQLDPPAHSIPMVLPSSLPMVLPSSSFPALQRLVLDLRSAAPSVLNTFRHLGSMQQLVQLS